MPDAPTTDTVTVHMPEVCEYSRTYAIAELAGLLNVAPTRDSIAAVLAGDAQVGDDLLDGVLRGFDQVLAREWGIA